MIKWTLTSPPPRSRNRIGCPGFCSFLRIFPSASLLEIIPSFMVITVWPLFVLLSMHAFVNSTLLLPVFEWNHTVHIFYFASFAHSHVLCVDQVHFYCCYFIWYTTNYFIVVGHLGCFQFGLLWTMLLWIFLCISYGAVSAF